MERMPIVGDIRTCRGDYDVVVRANSNIPNVYYGTSIRTMLHKYVLRNQSQYRTEGNYMQHSRLVFGRKL